MSVQVVRVGRSWIGRAAGEAGDVGPSPRLCAGLVNHLRVTYLQYLAFGGCDGGSA